VIACAIVIEEVAPFLPADVSYDSFDFGQHLRPEILKDTLQKKIDEVSAHVDAVLLGYGLCGMAVVGLKARTAALVIPRIDDCITLFLGSISARQDRAQNHPGTYFLTKSWIEAGETPFSQYQELVKKWGLPKARRLIELMLKNYRRIVFIRTGRNDPEKYRQYAQRAAAEFDLDYEEIAGSPALTKKLVVGPWDHEFVVVPPGETLTYDMFRKS
jgi:hypothetical protein